MKKLKSIFVISAIAIVFLLLLNFYFYAGFKAIKKQLTQKDTSYNQLEENFKSLKKSYDFLTKESESLQNSNLLLKDESNSLQLQMKSSKAEMEKAIEKLNNFEQNVKDSIAWFKKNSNIMDEDLYNSTKDQLKECVKSSNKCKIDTECIYEVNYRNGIRYTDDLSATGKDDRLKNLTAIYKQKGGDCEDFSLLFAAEYNYLVEYCLQNYSRREIISIAEDKEIEGNYIYVVCGGFDPGKIVTNWAGHCMVAISEYPIGKSSDVYYSIKDSHLIEPQNGRYMGQMGKTDLTYIFNTGATPSSFYRIEMIITEDDLYIYYPYDQDIKWEGYHDFLQKAQSLKSGVAK